MVLQRLDGPIWGKGHEGTLGDTGGYRVYEVAKDLSGFRLINRAYKCTSG